MFHIMTNRHYSFMDHLITSLDNSVRTLFGDNHSARPNPANNVREQKLTSHEKQHAGALMRINHSGEVAAQGLYQGQALTARLPGIRDQMEQAAQEEVDHLAWCKKRTEQLGTHTSYLDPVWYLGSVAIGAAAGLAGDKWSLGFVAETEKQVVNHLQEHIHKLPSNDQKSRAILEQMKIDEQHHATTAMANGAADLPGPVRKFMTFTSKIMTKTTYYF